MSDIFISYGSEDRSKVKNIANALELQGWSVWWDRNIPFGKPFHSVIEESVNKARCVLVVWSYNSIKSTWVKAEASEGIKRDMLVPITIDKAIPPLVFRQIHTADFNEWDGDTSSAVFQKLTKDISSLIGPPTNRSKMDREKIRPDRPQISQLDTPKEQFAFQYHWKHKSKIKWALYTLIASSLILLTLWMVIQIISPGLQLKNTHISKIKESQKNKEIKTVTELNELELTSAEVRANEDSISEMERLPGPYRKRIVVLYFDNSNGHKDRDFLKKGLADMMITDLSKIKLLDIVEREKLEEVIKEQNLQSTRHFDDSTAVKIGKLLGAEIILVGAYFEMSSQMRIDARMIDVETGRILKSEGVNGKNEEFFALKDQLIWLIAKDFDTQYTETTRENLVTHVSFNQVLEYSEALELYDRGDKVAAKKVLKNILKNQPEFKRAESLLQKLSK